MEIKRARPSARAGWIGPDGSFFTCMWYQHDSLAQSLMAQFGYATVEAWERDWLRLKYDPATRTAPFIEYDGFAEYSVTQPQLNALYDILGAFLIAGVDVSKLREYISFAKVRERKLN